MSKIWSLYSLLARISNWPVDNLSRFARKLRKWWNLNRHDVIQSNMSIETKLYSYRVWRVYYSDFGGYRWSQFPSLFEHGWFEQIKLGLFMQHYCSENTFRWRFSRQSSDVSEIMREAESHTARNTEKSVHSIRNRTQLSLQKSSLWCIDTL